MRSSKKKSFPDKSHYGISCDHCQCSPIWGPRYKCTVCDDYDLCSDCYHDGKHDLHHPFTRFKYDSSRFRNEKKLAARKEYQYTEEDKIHYGVRCDYCQCSPISGSRYKCTVCDNYDLCSYCYHDGKHYLHHPFARFKYDVRRFPNNGIEKRARKQRKSHRKYPRTDEDSDPDPDPDPEPEPEPDSDSNPDWVDIDWDPYSNPSGSDLFAEMERIQRNMDPQEVEELILTLGKTGLNKDSSGASSSQDPAQQFNAGSSMIPRSQSYEALWEQITCGICLEAPKDMAFKCGHSACAACSSKLKQCHICRKNITERIKLYT